MSFFHFAAHLAQIEQPNYKTELETTPNLLFLQAGVLTRLVKDSTAGDAKPENGNLFLQVGVLTRLLKKEVFENSSMVTTENYLNSFTNDVNLEYANI